MADLVLSGLEVLNQVFEAGIAITALSLFFRALSFNLRDRVSRAFVVILACVMVVFSGEAISSAVNSPAALEFWLKFQWVGIVLLPAAYLHFSDALLETTGRPSRGRRRFVVRLAYAASLGFMATLPFSFLVGPVVVDGEPLVHLERTWLSWVFTAYYVVVMLMAGSILWRAFSRTVLPSSRRRMRYLLGGALAIAVGTYPYLLLGSGMAREHPIAFLGTAATGNVLVFISLTAMAYAVAFFGIPWPDRVVKSRLFKWLLRGPVTVFFVLFLMTAFRSLSEYFGLEYGVVLPIVTVMVVLVLEHLITLAAPVWESWLFHGGDREDLGLLQSLEERLISRGDLRQFLEAILAAVCDQFQVQTAFIAVLGGRGMELVVRVGDSGLLEDEDLSGELLRVASGKNGGGDLFSWEGFWLLPLFDREEKDLLGLLGVLRPSKKPMAAELRRSLNLLGNRAALALEDRRMQRELFSSMESLTPQVDIIQRLRAAARYDQREMLSDIETLPEPKALSGLIRDALNHYWGGPKLTKSPLLNLRVVQETLGDHNGNPVNALRTILSEAIQRVRPEGERRFTAEWILYNILEMKFMEGRKVREIATRLAMSEADLYRKQRVAIEEVANAVLEMERLAEKEAAEG